MIVQIGPYPEPIGGISIYIKRLKEYMDFRGLDNEVWDFSNFKKDVKGVTNIRLKYLPIKLLFRKDIEIIHYNLCGTKSKFYIALFNKMVCRKKKILTIHGDSKDLFIKYEKLMVMSINTFDAIICVKSGDREYLYKKGINKPIYEVPAFIVPIDYNIKLPEYITNFISSKNFIIAANASYIQFYNGEDLYGIDMCIDLLEQLVKVKKDIGIIFCIPRINDLDYFENLNDRIKSKGLENEFIFVSENIELYPIIKLSNLFIRPTNNDGYGVSIAEAIYFGVPAVASDVCVRPAGTTLFKSRNLDDLYNKCIEVIDNYDDFKARLKMVKIQDNAEILLRIYEEII